MMPFSLSLCGSGFSGAPPKTEARAGWRSLHHLSTGLLMTLAPTAGCVTETLHDEWEEILADRRGSDLQLEGHFPPDGAFSVGLAVGAEVCGRWLARRPPNDSFPQGQGFPGLARLAPRRSAPRAGKRSARRAQSPKSSSKASESSSPCWSAGLSRPVRPG